MMLKLGRAIVCPYCFEKFGSQDIAFRCINSNTATACTPEKDEALGRYQRTPAQYMPPVFRPATAGRLVHCKCGVKTTKMVCPHCHNELPSQYDRSDSLVIAMIGAKEAGKSHYIAVLIHELSNRIGHRFNASLGALDDETIRRYREEFSQYVYEARRVLPTTDSGKTAVRYPLVYRLTLERKKAWLLRDLRVASLVFFDTAGEDFNEKKTMDEHTRYVANSQGLLFLLDPLQIPAVRQLAQSGIPLPSQNTSPKDIVDNVTRLIREQRGIDPHVRIKTPVAVTFSKIDAVRHLFGAQAAVNRASGHDGYFDLDDGERMNDEMRAHIADWCGEGLDDFLRANYESYAYFGISSLGSAPEAGLLTRGVSPFRVEDPFLWILHKHALIDGRRSGR